MAKVATTHPVPIWSLFLRMGGWFALVFLVVFLILTLISQTTLSLAKRFEVEGRQTTASVLDKYYSESRDSDGDVSIIYYLSLEFVAQSGDQHRVSTSVSSSRYNQTQISSTVPIWYLESEPERIELKRGANQTASTITQIIALIFGLLTLGGVWYSGSRSVAAVRARRFGTEERAEVLQLARTNVTVNGQSRYRLEWREASGRTGKSLMYPRAELEPYAGARDIVIYQGIKRAWWSGDVGPRL